MANIKTQNICYNNLLQTFKVNIQKTVSFDKNNKKQQINSQITRPHS